MTNIKERKKWLVNRSPHSFSTSLIHKIWQMGNYQQSEYESFVNFFLTNYNEIYHGKDLGKCSFILAF